MRYKRIISAFVWLLLFSTESISQNATYIIPIDSKNSIVREFAKKREGKTTISLSNQSFASMDATPLSLLPTLGQAILSGESNGRLHLWRHLRTETFDCHNEIELPLSIMAPDFTNTLYFTLYSKATQPFLHINPPVEIIEANIICSE